MESGFNCFECWCSISLRLFSPAKLKRAMWPLDHAGDVHGKISGRMMGLSSVWVTLLRLSRPRGGSQRSGSEPCKDSQGQRNLSVRHCLRAEVSDQRCSRITFGRMATDEPVCGCKAWDAGTFRQTAAGPGNLEGGLHPHEGFHLHAESLLTPCRRIDRPCC